MDRSDGGGAKGQYATVATKSDSTFSSHVHVRGLDKTLDTLLSHVNHLGANRVTELWYRSRRVFACEESLQNLLIHGVIDAKIVPDHYIICFNSFWVVF